ncbi:hypothetical protein [Chryseobacterium sp. MP_3.2]|uniref:hypothetical protein n=1 Tax=Chryseobacterium sp. MP_3.2 TaxID=3071712 RepID=UPI002DFE8C7D|nr:rubrerythrin [Chryseobacterium sp. MP_3.2]
MASIINLKTLRKNQLQSFIAGFLWKPAPKPEPETVATFASKNGWSANHEMWRTCNSCGDHFDVKKETKLCCPSCGSMDLRRP